MTEARLHDDAGTKLIPGMAGRLPAIYSMAGDLPLCGSWFRAYTPTTSTDDPEVAAMMIDPDLTIIDKFGVQAVADALEISREAVRKWRVKGAIPDHRRQEQSFVTSLPM